MLNSIRRLFQRKFTPLNLITISKQRLIDNYKELSIMNPQVKIAPVLKSNAYGHGIRLVGEILDRVNAPFLCVDSLYEAFQLQSKSKIKTPILIMGYIHEKSLAVKRLPFSFAIYDLKHAQILNEYQNGAKIHVFVDTGMHREGISMDDLPDFIKELKLLKNIEIEGLMSHLADSSNPKAEVTKQQVANFEKAKEMFLKEGITPKWFHLGGSYGLLNELVGECNLVRVGRAVYGIEEKDTVLNVKLEPVLKHTTRIVQIKKIKKGEKVGYSGTFTAPRDCTIAVLPLGYNDGVDRRMSNKGIMKIEEFICPIIGLVSMNICTIDISEVDNPYLDQEVEVFSDNADDPNSVVNASRRGGVLPHEMLIHIAESTKRVVV